MSFALITEYCDQMRNGECELSLMTNENLLTEVRNRAVALEFSTRWLVLELARRYEANISKDADVVKVRHGKVICYGRVLVMPEIKPCPFCGGNVSVYAYDPFDGYQGNLTRYRVFCLNCRASIEREDREKAIEAWNRRVDNG